MKFRTGFVSNSSSSSFIISEEKYNELMKYIKNVDTLKEKIQLFKKSKDFFHENISEMEIDQLIKDLNELPDKIAKAQQSFLYNDYQLDDEQFVLNFTSFDKFNDNCITMVEDISKYYKSFRECAFFKIKEYFEMRKENIEGFINDLKKLLEIMSWNYHGEDVDEWIKSLDNENKEKFKEFQNKYYDYIFEYYNESKSRFVFEALILGAKFIGFNTYRYNKVCKEPFYIGDDEIFECTRCFHTKLKDKNYNFDKEYKKIDEEFKNNFKHIFDIILITRDCVINTCKIVADDFNNMNIYIVEISDGGGCGFTSPILHSGFVINEFSDVKISHH